MPEPSLESDVRHSRWMIAALLAGGGIGALLRLLSDQPESTAHWERLIGVIGLLVLSAVAFVLTHGFRSWRDHWMSQATLFCLWLGFLAGWWLAGGYAWADFGATTFAIFLPACAGLGLVLRSCIAWRTAGHAGRRPSERP